MTAAEALENVANQFVEFWNAERGLPPLSPRDAEDLAEGFSSRLRTLGFAVVPVDADEATIEMGCRAAWDAHSSDGAWDLLSKSSRTVNKRRRADQIEDVRNAYAAMVAPDAEK